ncbi:hypothetical protein [Streptomyces sp. NPDC090445]|uniref:hypothetical protein n=1 Tax=Streptomyces sp. NPDC090445 TaxID=3365963 RepID=UPI00381B3ACC
MASSYGTRPVPPGAAQGDQRQWSPAAQAAVVGSAEAGRAAGRAGGRAGEDFVPGTVYRAAGSTRLLPRLLPRLLKVSPRGAVPHPPPV